ncbi:asparagine synthase (glutamine-hydrolyzing) [Thiocapsa imhoffii]|uniref:asparagine synthase (glutamine-hydrolyzing) n=1 Tax=Thiocapsa imhoffii TaxID=382777 RepID=A0A9X0WHP1_9GAMM|nr:asparagine synthase (glutamine-hydrolyzing) [Thiocapsa imhoffii]MBK1644907.1 asparagine synthase (glutamine-hydrolyzing) [Thiocapsa imhoffii]
MCGLAGILSWERPIEPDAVHAMTARLTHRGPDADGFIQRDAIALGHRRLSVIDVSAANNQPLQDHAGVLTIAFNGEIYNYRELRRELIARGGQFRTHGDTEVILEAYKAWGTGCLDRFNGMFAFALWDAPRRRLLLARDRLGEKPLFFVHLPDGGLLFASEPHALRAHPACPTAVDPIGLAHYLMLNYSLGAHSLQQGIERLPPGHFMCCEQGRVPRPEAYWDLASIYRAKRSFASEAAAADELLALIDDAVRLRLVSDVPLGAFLSGGVDSSAVAASMARVLPHEQVHTFSMGFGIASFDEVEQARAVAGALGLDHQDQVATAETAQTIAAIRWAAREPLADSSTIPTYLLAAFARQSVTVALSGDGADECFAGYETYAADRLHRALSWIPAGMARAGYRVADALLPVSFSKVSWDYKLRHFLAGLHLDGARAHASWRDILSRDERREMMQPAWRDLFDESTADPFSAFAPHVAAVKTCHPVDQAGYVDIKTWLADDILVKVDRSTMAHSLEARAPLLDHRLVEFAAALPVHWKLKGWRKKYLLRESLRGRLPGGVLDGSKRGFNAPISQWLNGALRDFARDTLASPRLHEWVRPQAIDALYRDHAAQRRDHGLKLYGLLCLALWLDHP